MKARQDVKPDFRHPPFTDYRQPPVDYRHPPATDYRQPPTLDYRQPPGLLDFRQHPAAAQFPLGIPADFRPQVRLDKELSAQLDFVYLFIYLFVFMAPHCRQVVSHHDCILLQWVCCLHIFCRTLIISRWSWKKAQRVLALVSVAAESTRWTYLCCALLRMVLQYVMEGWGWDGVDKMMKAKTKLKSSLGDDWNCSETCVTTQSQTLLSLD